MSSFARWPRLSRGSHASALYRLFFLLLLYHLMTSLVLSVFMTRFAFHGDWTRYGLEQLVDRTAYRPIVFRVLSPFLVRVASDVALERLPPRVADYMENRSPLLRYRSPAESWNRRKAVRFHAAYFYTYAAILAALLASRYLLHAARIGSRFFQDFAPVVALPFVLLAFNYIAYLYDFPELAFLLLATALALQRRWWLYYPLFVLAVLNKESNVMLGVTVGAIGLQFLTLRQLTVHAGLHLALGVPILVAIRLAFADSPGVPTEWHLPYNLFFWSLPRNYFSIVSGPAPLIPVPNGANVLTVGLALFGMFAFWREKPPWLRRLVLFTAAINLPLQLFFAMTDEMRNLSLMFPAVFLASCFTISRLYSGFSTSGGAPAGIAGPPALAARVSSGP